MFPAACLRPTLVQYRCHARDLQSRYKTGQKARSALPIEHLHSLYFFITITAYSPQRLVRSERHRLYYCYIEWLRISLSLPTILYLVIAFLRELVGMG